MNFQAINVIGECQQLAQMVQTVERQAQEEEITPATCKELFNALDEISHSIQSLRAQPHAVDEFAQAHLEKLSDLEEKIVFLYGDVYTRFVDREVVQIKKEAEQIAVSFGNGTMNGVASKVDSLKQHISTLCQSNALSRKNLIVIHTVEKLVEIAEAALTGSVLSPALNQIGKLLSQLLLQSEERSEMEMDPMEAEILVELCEIIDLFSDRQSLAAQRKLRNLPLGVQKRVESHMKTMQNMGIEAPNCIEALQVTSQEIMMGKEQLMPDLFILSSAKKEESLSQEHSWFLA